MHVRMRYVLIKELTYLLTVLKQEAFEKCWAHSLLQAAITSPVTRCRRVASRTPATAIAQATCDVHDINNNNNNDNA